MLKLAYITAVMVAAGLTVALALHSYKKGANSLALKFFRFFLVAIAVWSFASGMQLLQAQFGWQRSWLNLSYLGVVATPALWFLFCGFYTGVLQCWRTWYFALFAVPLGTLGLLWSNPIHHLMWRSSQLDWGDGFAVLRTTKGIWFSVVHTPYSYLLIGLSLFVLLRGFLATQRGERRKIYLLSLILPVPIVADLVSLAGLLPSALDITPLGFVVGAAVLAYGMSNWQLVERRPLAYRDVFVHLHEAVVVLNEAGVVVDLNSEAEALLGLSVKQVGLAAADFLFTPSVFSALAAGEVVELTHIGRYLELRQTTLGEASAGQLLIVNDVSERKVAELSQRRQLKHLGAVIDMSDRLRDLHSREEINEATLDLMVQLTGADVCSLAFYKQANYQSDELSVQQATSSDYLEVASCRRHGKTVQSVVGQILRRGEGLSWQVIDVADTVRLYAPEGLSHAKQYDELDIPHDFLGTPLKDKDGLVFGVLNALYTTPDKQFRAEDSTFIEAIALASSSALIRLELLEEADTQTARYRQLYTEAERQAQELSLLDTIRTAIAQQLDLQQVIEATVNSIAEVAGYDMVSLYWLSQDGSRLELQHQVGYPVTVDSISLDQGIVGRVAWTGQAILLADAARRPEFHGTLTDVSSQVAVPIFDDGAVVGVLNIETCGAQKLQRSDLELLIKLTEKVSIAAQRARLYGEVQANSQRLELLTNNMSDLICLHDIRGRFSYLTPSSETVLGYAGQALIGTSPIELFHPDDRAFVKKTIFKRLRAGEEIRPFTYRVRQQSGEYVWLESFVQAVYSDTGKLTHFVSASRDVTERKQMQQQMVEGALLYDNLTNLPNRALFMDRLQQAIKQGDEATFSVLFLDLDRFKVINDSLGHSAGDCLLVEASRRLQSCLRAQDTVARLGGDEFAVLLEGMAEDEASELAGRLQEELAKPFQLAGHTVFSSASIGITLGEEFADPEQLLRNADLAMYHAKTSGKARFALFDKSMHQRMTELMSLESDLRRAIELNELRVVYQPVIKLADGSLSGFEALVRWEHGSRGTISPITFIPIAEEMGMIAEIDAFVLQEACFQLKQWEVYRTDLTMSVNLSTKNFVLSDLVARIGETLAKTEIAPSQLKLEITETVLVENAVAAHDLLSQLREQGIALQIDDFGTGYSSLGYLHQLPLDSLKIDRSFVASLSQQDDAIVKTIVSLARSLGLDVVAEGIETHEQLEQLMVLGCDYGQGYLFAEPLGSREVEQHFFEGMRVTPDVTTQPSESANPLQKVLQDA